jgi:hypothetical protein
MMRIMRYGSSSLLLLLLAAVPAGADRLVTRAGGQIETRGPWQVKGKLVVFTGANGSLGSLRLADVDLAASEAATAEAKRAKEQADSPGTPKPAERKKSVRSLTDADFSHKPAAADDGAAKPEGDGKDKGSDAKPAPEKGTVTVSSWSKADRAEGDGIDLFGTLQNTGKEHASEIRLKVTLINEAKETVGTGEGVLAATEIPPGGSTSFRVPFAGVFSFAEARFEVANHNVTITPVDDPAAKKKAAPPANSGKP